MGARALIGAALALGCASEPRATLEPPRLAAREVARPAVEVPRTAEVSPPAAPEPALGVEDRGVYADLDPRVQLPAPPAGVKLHGLIDVRHKLMVVYADDWPLKVYPLSGGEEVELGGERVRLRAGDRAELAGRRLQLRRLDAAEVAPPGDHDGDGIPDPLDVLIGAYKTVLDAADYDDAYFTLRYPNGDPPRNRGACVDVIVRAVRNAGVDLQARVIEDERANGRAYGVTRPDPSIDHRRVRNAVVFFQRHWDARAAALDDPRDPLRPGDVVFLDTFPNRPGPDHVGVVTPTRGTSGNPLVINLWTFGYKTQAMDLLGTIPVTHRFRFPSRPAR